MTKCVLPWYNCTSLLVGSVHTVILIDSEDKNACAEYGQGRLIGILLCRVAETDIADFDQKPTHFASAD